MHIRKNQNPNIFRLCPTHYTSAYPRLFPSLENNTEDISPAFEKKPYVAKEILHLPGETNEELIAALVQKIRDLNDQLNIPQSIKDYANGGVKVDAENPQMVSEEEFLAKLPEIAANAEQDACTPENPRETKAADFEKILKACYYDTDIDF